MGEIMVGLPSQYVFYIIKNWKIWEFGYGSPEKLFGYFNSC